MLRSRFNPEIKILLACDRPLASKSTGGKPAPPHLTAGETRPATELTGGKPAPSDLAAGDITTTEPPVSEWTRDEPIPLLTAVSRPPPAISAPVTGAPSPVSWGRIPFPAVSCRRATSPAVSCGKASPSVVSSGRAQRRAAAMSRTSPGGQAGWGGWVVARVQSCEVVRAARADCLKRGGGERGGSHGGRTGGAELIGDKNRFFTVSLLVSDSFPFTFILRTVRHFR
jgi:hypothetical protein